MIRFSLEYISYFRQSIYTSTGDSMVLSLIIWHTDQNTILDAYIKVKMVAYNLNESKPLEFIPYRSDSGV